MRVQSTEYRTAVVRGRVLVSVSNELRLTANTHCYDEGHQGTDLNLNIMKVTTLGLSPSSQLHVRTFQLFILLFFILLDLLYEKDRSR